MKKRSQIQSIGASPPAIPERVGVAPGIDIEGNKHPLALVEGSTENATLVCGLLVDLRERGPDVTRPFPVGIDGSRAPRKAVLDVLDPPLIQRRQLHYADVGIRCPRFET